MRKSKTMILLFLAIVAILFTAQVNAGETTLSNNSGDRNTVWFISGEASLVMNGFDLTPLNVQLPAIVDRVSIAVEQSTPGVPVDVVIYQDANGGSPVDAVLAGQAQVTIDEAGVFTATFDPPVLITQPVVWVGFYLPVDFRFLADTSGTSVLTYWAWSPNTRFSLADLSSAFVLGPADGSAPVELDMEGKARITAEISSDQDRDRIADANDNCPTVFNPSQHDAFGDGIGEACDPGNPTGAEPMQEFTPILQTSSSTDLTGLAVLRSYVGCETLFRDTADINISYRDGIDLHCQEIWAGFAPDSPDGFDRKQLLYDVAVYDDGGVIAGDLTIPVSHCIEPNSGDLNQELFVGLASGVPRTWEILPSERFGNLICAEVSHGGNLSYFTRAIVPVEAEADQ